jgi:phosphoglycerate kinase
MKTTINDLDELHGKRVLIRVDFNVPLDKKSGAITNDRRIRAAVPTIESLLEKGATVIAMTHVGRPSGDPGKDVVLRTDAIAVRLAELLGRPVKKAGDTVTGAAVADVVGVSKPGDMLILENLRFDPREQKNDPGFANELAEMGDVYVNDAFGTCHNDKDTSMVGLPAAMKENRKPRAVGLLVAKELEIIDGLMSSPKRPVVAIMGGAKVTDKIAFINALLGKVDQLLIGGKMAYTFMKARGESVGDMAIPDEELAAAKKLLPQVGTKITLPVDSLVAKTGELSETKVIDGPIPAGWAGVDIGPKTLANYATKIATAGTVIWNGPVGWFEQPAYSAGTKGIAEAMANSGAVTVVGGGETAEADEEFGFDKKMTHVSTGGGAFLAYVEGKPFASLAQIDDR